ncbi:MAG: hypothetical protein IT190_07225 [Microbacteriaceae bacterium]|jgi:hypothetical protein|nr:hypothetical protein [Microbacteriaceae bacterium]
MKIKSLFLPTLLGLLSIFACSPSVLTLPPTTPEPSQTSSPIPTEPTATFHIPTAISTLLLEQEKLLADSLQSTTCTLPCYLGIIPGKTTLETAKKILDGLGGKYSSRIQRMETDGAFLDTYHFHLGDPDSGKKIGYAAVILISDNDLVQLIEFASGTGRLQVLGSHLFEKSLNVYRNYWQRYYTARQIFLQLGEPEELYLVGDSTFELIIFYKHPIAKIIISGSAEENNLCSQYASVDYISVYSTISNDNSPFDANGDGEVPLTDREEYIPIEEALGITTKEFYEQVLADPSICFNRKP